MSLITLTRGFTALVDDDLFEALSQWKWRASGHKKPYAVRTHGFRGPTIYLHRLVMGEPLGLDVDHRDGNRMDCRRGNLRVCEHAENCRNSALMSNNTSGIKGVSWDARNSKWIASLQVDGRLVWLGRYVDRDVAAAVVEHARQRAHGEFACDGVNR